MNMENVISTLKRLFFELVIVFLGVFLAFQLNNYRQSIANNKIKERYYGLILAEFKSNLAEVKFTKNLVSAYLDTLAVQIENGNKPKLNSLENYALDNNLFVIKSAFESGHLENLNPRFINNISVGSNYLTRLSNRINQFNDKVNLAYQSNDWLSDKFYTKNGQLKAEFEWYMNDLHFILKYLNNLETAIEEGAIPDIEKVIKGES